MILHRKNKRVRKKKSCAKNVRREVFDSQKFRLIGWKSDGKGSMIYIKWLVPLFICGELDTSLH